MHCIDSHGLHGSGEPAGLRLLLEGAWASLGGMEQPQRALGCIPSARLSLLVTQPNGFRLRSISWAQEKASTNTRLSIGALICWARRDEGFGRGFRSFSKPYDTPRGTPPKTKGVPLSARLQPPEKSVSLPLSGPVNVYCTKNWSSWDKDR